MDQNEVNSVLTLLRQSEALGEKVIADREELVQMDRIRQANREALSSLKRKPEQEGVYLCLGNMFFKHRVKTARELIQKDQTNVNDHIERLRRQLKSNVQKLHELEEKSDEFESFNLTPMSSQEMRGINVILQSIKKHDLNV